MKKPPARHLSTVLQNSPILAELSARVEIMAAVQKALGTEWSGLHLRVLSMRDGCLNLATKSAAVAAKARQMEPSMLAVAQRVNPSIQTIRFKPDKSGPASLGAIEPNPRNRQIGSECLEQIQMAASEMAVGPTRAALERLIRRQLSQG